MKSPSDSMTPIDATPTPPSASAACVLGTLDPGFVLHDFRNHLRRQNELDPITDAALQLGIDALTALREQGWQPLNTDHSVWPWEAELLLLWHPLWERGVTAGYYHEPTDQWRGLSDEGWFALGIPPSHYCLPTPPERTP